MKSEFQLIESIIAKIPRRLQGPMGIGDDAAVLPATRGRRWLLTTDTLVEGVDFHFKGTSAAKVGRKALAVNLSDLAAMGGSPVACVVALGIPRKVNEKWLEQFYAGLTPMAQKYRTLCAGGDISRSREFFVSIALLGWAERGEIVTRKGAREGDWIMVTGRLGGSILGRHFLFEPRVREGRFLADRFHPTSMIDISDGLVQDLEHVLRQSKKRACLDLDAVPVSDQAFKLANRHHGRALVHALTDGEDFELLFTLPPSRKAKLEREWKRKFPETSLTAIGRIRRGKPGIEWVRGERPARAPALRKKGFAHF